MEATQQRVQGKRLHCGSLMALLTGRAAFTTGSMSKACSISLPLAAQHPIYFRTSLLMKLLSFAFYLGLVIPIALAP